MKALVLAVLVGFWDPGLGFAQSFQTFFDPLPAPPDLAIASAGFTRANQDYAQSAATWPRFDQAFLATVPVPSETWETVRKLKANKKIRVVSGDLERIKGRFVSATADEITFRMSGKSHRLVTMPRNDVRMVSIRHSKVKEILALALVGALAGAVAMADSSNNDCWSCSWEERDQATGTELAVGAAVGAVAFAVAGGLAEPSDEVIYFGQTKEVPTPDSTRGEAAMSEPSENSAATTSHADSGGPSSVEAGQPEGGNVIIPVISGKPEQGSEVGNEDPN